MSAYQYQAGGDANSRKQLLFEAMLRGLGNEIWPQSARLKGALDNPIAALALELERKDVAGADDLAFHATDFTDPFDTPDAITHPLDLNHKIDGAGDLRARSALNGRLALAIKIIFSSRNRASRGLLAWIVDIDPSWPVFIAWSMSKASLPLTSPTMIRSGRIRSALRTSSRWGI